MTTKTQKLSNWHQLTDREQLACLSKKQKVDINGSVVIKHRRGTVNAISRWVKLIDDRPYVLVNGQPWQVYPSRVRLENGIRYIVFRLTP